MGVSQMGHVSFLSSLRERGSPAERSRRGPTAHVTDVCRCMQDTPPPGHACPTGVICECSIICLLLNMCLCIYMCLHVPSREGHPHNSIVACHAPCLRRLAPLVNAGQVEMVSAVGPYLRVICAPPPPPRRHVRYKYQGCSIPGPPSHYSGLRLRAPDSAIVQGWHAVVAAETPAMPALHQQGRQLVRVAENSRACPPHVQHTLQS